jgi:ATP-dependent DNA helicase DinG
LAQSVGRLIRTDLDHGTVFILDGRLVSARWSRALLKGLPPFKLELAPNKEAERFSRDRA